MPKGKNIFRRVYDAVKENRTLYVAPTTALGLPYGVQDTPIAIRAALQLSAVYRCVEVVSDAIASQMWEFFEYQKPDKWKPNNQHPTAYMLNYEPHPFMSRFTMMKTLITKVLLEGNGFLVINRNGVGDPISLDLVHDDVKMFIMKDGTIRYEIAGDEQRKSRIVLGEDMIHVMNFSYNGLIGVSTLTHAALSMGLATAAESTAKGFFLSGANMSGIVSMETGGKLTKEKAAAIKESWAQAFNITSGQPGGIAVMEGGLKFSPVTVNPKDAQMLETRQFNVVEICRFFGVAPSKVFDDSNLTYSNIESFQLGFLTDTISPLDSKIEGEFQRKLLRPSKRITTRLNLSIKELLRANMDAKANYVSKMFQCGGYTVNEVRQEAGNPPVPKGDDAYVQVNMMKVGVEPVKPVVKPPVKPIVESIKQEDGNE